MIEIITSAFSSLQLEATSYSPGVQAWMKVMALSFISSLLFVYHFSGARWILFAFVVNVLGLLLGRILFPELSRTEIGTGVHLLFWPGVLLAVWLPKRRPLLFWQNRNNFERLYMVWICWASLLLAISVFLDARTFLTLIS